RGIVSPHQQVTQIVQRLRVVRVELDRFSVGRLRVVVPPEPLEDEPEIVPAGGGVGTERRGASDQRERVVKVARLESDHAEKVQRIAMVGAALEDAPVAAFGFGKTSGAVMGERLRERAFYERVL